MKRLLLAGLFVLPFAFARAQDNAYESLIGMADSAASDRGPQLEEIPQDAPSVEGHVSSRTQAKEAAQKIGASSTRTATSSLKVPKTAHAEQRHEDAAELVSVPLPSAPRVWTRLFASLLPSMPRTASFEVVVSTGVRRTRPEPEPAMTSASAAGAAQGLRELVATATAPIR